MTGVGPTVGRATALAAAELATYDEVTFKARTSMKDGELRLTLCTAFISGYVSTVASSPFDVVKPRDGAAEAARRLARDVLGDGRLLHQVVAVGGLHVALQWLLAQLRPVPRVTIVFLVMEHSRRTWLSAQARVSVSILR